MKKLILFVSTTLLALTISAQALVKADEAKLALTAAIACQNKFAEVIAEAKYWFTKFTRI